MTRLSGMNDGEVKLLLLPGMDGTGDLFADLIAALPSWIMPCIVSYPRDKRLNYDQLMAGVRSALPSDGPFVILAESFSTPLAVKIAAECPKWLRALVLCAGFVSPPRRDFLSSITSVLAPLIFEFRMPESVCRRFLVGRTAPQELVENVISTVSRVSPRVLAHRFRSVLSCNSKDELPRVSVPLLYVAGTEDRLVGKNSFEEIKDVKPTALFAGVQAPHLILQSNPRESAVIVEFLHKT